MTDYGFTGSQRGMTAEQKASVAALITGGSTFRHGDCIGSDDEAHDLALGVGYFGAIEVHPPRNPSKRAFRTEGVRLTHPEKEYLDRNKDIVLHCARLVAAVAEFDEVLRSGTWSTKRYAERVGRDYAVVYPDGSVLYSQPHAW